MQANVKLDLSCVEMLDSEICKRRGCDLDVSRCMSERRFSKSAVLD